MNDDGKRIPSFFFSFPLSSLPREGKEGKGERREGEKGGGGGRRRKRVGAHTAEGGREGGNGAGVRGRLGVCVGVGGGRVRQDG